MVRKMSNHRLLAILVIVTIVLSSFFIYTSTGSNEKQSTPNPRDLLRKYNYYKLVETAASIAHIDLARDHVKAYEYLLGGRFMEIPVSKLEAIGIHLINESPYAIRIGAYTGKEWVELPVRVFNRKFESPLSIIYHIPPLIDNRSTVQLILPDKMPVRNDNLYRERPEFARGSDKVYIAVLKFRIDNIKLEFPLYIAINNEHPHPLGSISNVQYRNINDEFTAKFSIPGLIFLNQPLIKKSMMKKLGLDEKKYRAFIDTLSEKPIRRGYTIEMPNPPWGPIPDGGSETPTYDVFESRNYAADPEHYSKIILTSSNATVTIPIHITDPSTDIDDDLVRTADEELTIFAVEKNFQPVTRTMTVTFIGRTYTYTIRGDKVNKITIYRGKLLVGKTELGSTYNVKITMSGINNDQWIIKLSSSFFFDTDKNAIYSHMNKYLKLAILPFDTQGINWNIPVYNGSNYSNTLNISYVFYIQNFPELGYIMDTDLLIKSYNITVRVDPSNYYGSTYDLEIQIGNKLVTNTITGPGIYTYEFKNVYVAPYLEKHEPVPVVLHVKFIHVGSEAVNHHMETFWISGSHALIEIRPCFERNIGTDNYVYTSLFSDSRNLWTSLARREIASGIAGYARVNVHSSAWESPTGTALHNMFIRTDIIGLGEPISGNEYDGKIYIQVTPFGIDTEDSYEEYYYGYREPVIKKLVVKYQNEWISNIPKDDIKAMEFDPGIGASWPDVSLEGLLGSLGSAVFSKIFSSLISSTVGDAIDYFLMGYRYLKQYLTASLDIKSDGKHYFEITYETNTGTTRPFLFKAGIYASNIPSNDTNKYIYSYVTIEATIYEKDNYAQSYVIQQTIPVRNYVVG